MNKNQKQITLEDALNTLDRFFISKTLIKSNGNITEAGRLLGITYRMVKYKMVKFGIKYEELTTDMDKTKKELKELDNRLKRMMKCLKYA